MNYFPMFFDLSGQKVLVVGGGEVAFRKISLLMRTGALITVVAPEILAQLHKMAHANAAAQIQLNLQIRKFISDDLNQVRLVIVATADRDLNRSIAKLAEERAIPVNVVDDLKASRFIVPALIDRDPVLVAISTGGASPVLARRLRERLEALIPQRFGPLAVWLQELRKSSGERLPSTAVRRRFFETIIDGASASRFIEGDKQGARRIAQELLEATLASLGETTVHPTTVGSVMLVGAGPGDPELLTLKALRALQDADVIFYDRLVPAGILDLARRDASRVCVGKASGGPSTTQDSITALLIRHAQQGERVVRLKGGDPFIFGRGGEELEALAAAKINFSVVPGITAALGCAAYAGIPLTHRDHAQSVSFVTGHADRQGKEPDWRALAMPGTTAVFYMGLARLEHIVERLLAHGAPPSRAAGLISQGTTEQQRVITATLAGIGAAAALAQLESPGLLIVGDVVALYKSLKWFTR